MKEMYTISGYIHLKKKDGKEWFFNLDDYKRGLVLYQPSKKSGKMMKKFLEIIGKTYLLGAIDLRRFGIDTENPHSSSAAERIIKELYPNVEHIFFSFFLGTPCAHQKETIQISGDNRILGYCKVTRSQEIFELFKREAELLEYLDQCGVHNIPKCLFCNEIQEEYLFIQDTHKTLDSLQNNKITQTVCDFLNDFYSKTAVMCQYIDSDIFDSISILRNNCPTMKQLLTEKDYHLLVSAINYVEMELSEKKVFYAAHRDFTPWNMYYEKNQLEVFDFEYGKKTYPKEIDYMHFIFQSMIYASNASPSQIIQKIEKNSYLFSTDYKFTCICYILDYFSLYIEREGKNISDNIIKNIRIRMEILKTYYLLLNNEKL